MSNTNTQEQRSVFFELLELVDFPEGRCWHYQAYAPNAVILREGEQSGKIFLILEGAVRVLGNVSLGDGYHVRPGVNELGRGDTFGEFSLLDQGVHSATVTAISDCRLVVIDNQQLLEYLDAHQAFGYRLYREMAVCLVRRMRAANEKILSLLAWGFKAHGYDKYMKADV